MVQWAIGMHACMHACKVECPSYEATACSIVHSHHHASFPKWLLSSSQGIRAGGPPPLAVALDRIPFLIYELWSPRPPWPSTKNIWLHTVHLDAWQTVCTMQVLDSATCTNNIGVPQDTRLTRPQYYLHTLRSSGHKIEDSIKKNLLVHRGSGFFKVGFRFPSLIENRGAV
jgi:hypothetical protein